MYIARELKHVYIYLFRRRSVLFLETIVMFLGEAPDTVRP